MNEYFDAAFATTMRQINDALSQPHDGDIRSLLEDARHTLVWAHNLMLLDMGQHEQDCLCCGCGKQMEWGDGQIAAWSGEGRFACWDCFRTLYWRVFDVEPHAFDIKRNFQTERSKAFAQ